MVNSEKGRTWAEIDLSAFAKNAQEIRRVTDDKAMLMGVVKTDAYGHGSVRVAKVLLQNGFDWLAVATVDEAVELREAGIEAPILILSDAEPERVDILHKYNISQSVGSAQVCERIAKEAQALGVKIKVHYKIDTGMGRLGFYPQSAVEEILRLSAMEGIESQGIFTHFAISDEEDESYTYRQFDIFTKVCQGLKELKLIRHAANSAAIIRFPQMHLDMVRAGIILYGLHPSEVTKKYDIVLKPCMTLKSRIIHVKDLPKGSSVSYGRVFIADKDIKLATVLVGYGDGYMRALGNRASMTVKGVRAEIKGRVCMDQTMIDVSGIEDVKVGDQVVVFGDPLEGAVHIDELARMAGTINYEMTCMINKRVPRVYI